MNIQCKRIGRVATMLCSLLTLSSYAANQEPIGRVGILPAQMMAAKITVADLRRSYDFYTGIIGLMTVEDPILPKDTVDHINQTGGEIIVNATGSLAEAHLCLVRLNNLHPTAKQTELTTVVVKVADVRAVVKRAKAAGFEVDDKIDVTMGMVFGFVRDPDGYGVEILQAKSFPTP